MNSKQKILVDIYTEYRKDIPYMEKNIKPELLGLETDVFNIAINNEGYITGEEIIKVGIGNKIHMTFLNNMVITKNGINYVESKIGIEET